MGRHTCLHFIWVKSSLFLGRKDDMENINKKNLAYKQSRILDKTVDKQT